MRLESRGVGQMDEIAEEGEPIGCMGREEPLQDQAPKQVRQHPHWQEEAAPASDPAAPVGAQTAAQHNAKRLRMVGERGSPSLQHQGGGDLGAQMLGVGADRGQCLGRPKTASRGRGPEKGAALGHRLINRIHYLADASLTSAR